VVVENPGERIQDYHTIQSPEKSQAEAMRAQTRADELSVASVHTTITRREYVSGAAYTVLLLADTDSPVVSATEIVEALRRPVFSLYAGRRSCALGRLAAEEVAGDLDALLPNATHWDHRMSTGRTPSLIRERRDQRAGPFAYAIRHECVA
jgi:CRISPR system Cascade subunit CasD